MVTGIYQEVELSLGDVLARKTFTPNFLTHKAKKNNNDRTQYRQRDHHEAIVSRDVFNAANHLRASRTYKKKNHPLPVLSVVDDGVLRGYVPFDKDWTGFSAEEYREASESVMREKQSNTVEVRKRLDLTGYEVVRAQYFATLQNPAMTISNGRLRFNAACLKKFDDVEYVELLLNSVDRCIAIRPCEKSNPNAIRWGRLKEGRWCASTLGCRGLAKTLFDIMEWDEDLKYRFRGQLVEQGGDKLMLFELDRAYGKINKSEQNKINKRIADLFTGKIGSVVTNSVDSIVISSFLGLTALSIYSNYYYIFTACVTMVAILFSAVLAGIGNSLIVDSKEKVYDDFKCATLIISWIAGFISCCLMCLFQPFIKWWMGENALLPLSCVILFAVEFYIYEMVVLCVTYKDAAGIWHEDRFRPLIGAVINLCLNIILVKPMGTAGVILATVVSFAIINFPWLIHNIFSIIFKRSSKEFVLIVLKYSVITLVATMVSYFLCNFFRMDGLIGLIINGLICLLVLNGLFFICVYKTTEFSHAKRLILGKLKR